jgi:hypothetical protein
MANVKPSKKVKVINYNLTNQKINRKTEILREEIDEEVLLFNPKTRETYVLNQMADVIWELCDGKHTPAGITDEIVDVLEVNSDQVRKDVLEVIKDFFDQNLVDVN